MNLRDILVESFSLNYGDKKFKVQLSPGVNPTKQGLRVRFYIIQGADNMTGSDKKDLGVALQKILNKSLMDYEISVNYDPDSPQNDGGESRPNIGFYIDINQFESLIEKALKTTIGQNSKSSKNKRDEEEPKKKSSNSEL